MQKTKIGILSTGNIAHTMARTVAQMPNAEVYAVASRNLQNAESFAREYNVPKAYGSYEELANDKDVELIYVASPHSHHFEHAMLCIETGRPVLCEKAFTANAKQAKILLETAESKKVFITEAIWTRFQPLVKTVAKILADGIIGKPHMLVAGLGAKIAHVERLVNPALAGGALLDLGIYPITIASVMLGSNVQSVASSVCLYHTGVDAAENITLNYGGECLAVLNASFVNNLPTSWNIYGENGSIEVEGITNHKLARVFDNNGNQTALYEAPAQISGYEYEVQASIDAIREGKLECSEIPHAETLRIMQLMDDLRASWNVRYPFEV